MILTIKNFEEIKITKNLWNYKLENFSKNRNIFYRPRKNFSIKGSTLGNSNFYNPIIIKLEKTKKLVKLEITKNCNFPIICLNSNLDNNFILVKNNILDFNCEKTNFEKFSNLKNSYKKIFQKKKIPKKFFFFDFFNQNLKNKFIFLFCAEFEKKSILDFSYKIEIFEKLKKNDFLIELKNDENLINYENSIKLEKISENFVKFSKNIKNFKISFFEENFENFEIYYNLEKSEKTYILLTKNEIRGRYLSNLRLKIINKEKIEKILNLKIF